jgi:hypothetical protein
MEGVLVAVAEAVDDTEETGALQKGMKKNASPKSRDTLSIRLLSYTRGSMKSSGTFPYVPVFGSKVNSPRFLLLYMPFSRSTTSPRYSYLLRVFLPFLVETAADAYLSFGPE